MFNVQHIACVDYFYTGKYALLFMSGIQKCDYL